MAVLFSSMFAGVSVLWDKQFGFLQEVLVAPVSRLSIVIGRTLGGATTALIQGFAILAISFFLGIPIRIGFCLLVGIIFMILIAFGSVGFGLIIASRMEDFHGFQLIMNIIIVPLVFLSSAIFPLEGLPSWLKFLAYLNPLTYGIDGLRGSLIGLSHFSVSTDFLIVLIICAIMMALGSYSFERQEV
jgi:ABC-2 type transport system permease protein